MIVELLFRRINDPQLVGLELRPEFVDLVDDAFAVRAQRHNAHQIIGGSRVRVVQLSLAQLPQHIFDPSHLRLAGANKDVRVVKVGLDTRCSRTSFVAEESVDGGLGGEWIDGG